MGVVAGTLVKVLRELDLPRLAYTPKSRLERRNPRRSTPRVDRRTGSSPFHIRPGRIAGPHPLPSRQFQALFDSLFKVLFIFPSRYLFAIGLSPIFSLGRNLPPDWGCIPKQPDSPTAPRGATGSGHNGALTLSGAPFQGTWARSAAEDASPDYNSNASRRPILKLGTSRRALGRMASGATCVQRLDDSRDSAIHTKYRISLHVDAGTHIVSEAAGDALWFQFLGTFRAGVRFTDEVATVASNGLWPDGRHGVPPTVWGRKAAKPLAPCGYHAFSGRSAGAGFDNDPSAGSPTETLLRLLLPLNDKVQWTSRDVAGSEPPTSPRSEHFTGPFNRLPGPVGQGYKLVEYISVARVRPRTSKGITDLLLPQTSLA
uniref:Uncharacterized protein n=1 Tax=Fagus sylvatica TaxID=28930 RepID=A0A2N9IEW7_FAGSY